LHREFVYLAVILDAYSRKVVGWELVGTLVARLPIAALEKAIAELKPPPDLVHHFDRGVQYASGDYVRVLTKHHMIPSLSRPLQEQNWRHRRSPKATQTQLEYFEELARFEAPVLEQKNPRLAEYISELRGAWEALAVVRRLRLVAGIPICNGDGHCLEHPAARCMAGQHETCAAYRQLLSLSVSRCGKG
jgi:hypothetical protein